MDVQEIRKLDAYIKRLFGNPQLRVVPRPKKDDSAEVYIGEEFIGVLFVDDEDDERSYNFQMAILRPISTNWAGQPRGAALTRASTFPPAATSRSAGRWRRPPPASRQPVARKAEGERGCAVGPLVEAHGER